MHNIILKNKTLIKLYKSFIKVFKFLNKHLYILSFISIIAKFRKSNAYKAISWLIKIVIGINILIVGGLFLNITDFQTPIDMIYNLYYDILGPYIEYIKSKINILLEFFNNIEDNLITQYKTNNNISAGEAATATQEILTEVDIIEAEDLDLPSPNFKNIVFYAGCIFFAYFIFYIPSNISPTELGEYNFINQSLIETKIVIKDLIFGSSPRGGSGATGKAIATADVELTTINSPCEASVQSVDSHSPSPFQTPLPRTPSSIPGSDVAEIVINDARTTNPSNIASGSNGISNNFSPSVLVNHSVQTNQTNNLIIKRFKSIAIQTDTDLTNAELNNLAFLNKLNKVANHKPELRNILNSIHLLQDDNPFFK